MGKNSSGNPRLFTGEGPVRLRSGQVRATRNKERRLRSVRPTLARALRLLYCDHRALLFSLVGLQDAFAEAEGLGSDFYEFVVGDELDGLLEIQVAERDEADG